MGEITMKYLDINNEQEVTEWVKHFVGYVTDGKQDQAASMMDVVQEADRVTLYNKVRESLAESHPEIKLPDLVLAESVVEEVPTTESEVEVADEVAKSDNGEQLTETLSKELVEGLSEEVINKAAIDALRQTADELEAETSSDEPEDIIA